MKTKIDHKSIWTIAYPIILGSVAQNIISVTDTAFLGHLSETALGAAAIATIFYFAIVMFVWGFGLGTQIVIARRVGEQNFKMVGKTFIHSFYFLMFVGALLLGFMVIQSPSLLKWMVSSDGIYQASNDYISVRAWGILFACVNLLFRAFYIGIAKTKVISWSTAFMAIVNVFFDYALIFGKFGLPEMGIKGAALASVIAEFTAMIFFIIYTLKKVPLAHYDLFRFCKIDWPLFNRLIKVSFPIMIQNFLSLSCWFVFFIMVERMGEHELAISNIIRSIYVLLMVPVWAFGSAVNTLVSQVIGEGFPDKIMLVIWRTTQLSFLSVLALVGISIFIPDLIISIYTDNVLLIEHSRPVVYVVFGSSLLFPIAITLFHGISGTGRTLHAMVLEIVVLSFYLGSVYLLVHVFKASIAMVWTSEYFYALFLGTASFLYLRYGKWLGSVV
ncbi:MATE family efflux transporter [Ancylomarina euxinus]|uniref:MATE family efflux transporter n=1 Tax=Ancylomarina euxinus TaxID=2283627 RepID=UPI0012E14875|nr:MATE family efflux transporter [Ancylomarina euxinus]MCZ4696076.1 MATE family efflux transporter [Ancylomarina euxinus]